MARDTTPTAPTIQFSIARSAAWAPGVETPDEWDAWARGAREIGGDSEPALRQMAPLLRRHTGRLGRMACDVAYRALDGAVGVPIVFCSRYGEAARSVELMRSLAERSALSPTNFSLSVHNSVAGLLSIARRDTANSLAIAAGEASAAHGVIEACGLLADGAEQVLLVVADCPLPPVYEPFAEVLPLAYAWAWLMRAAGDGVVTLEWDAAPSAEPGVARPPAGLEVLRFHQRGDAELVHTAGLHRWRWTHRA